MQTAINSRRIVKNAKQRRKKMIAFGWYGGKFSHLDFILPHLPEDAIHFCDVFGGSAAILINRKPAQLETYNDLDCRGRTASYPATPPHRPLRAELPHKVLQGYSLRHPAIR
ncbi:MAG: DNA adenine methylase [Candidatus Electrothrix sp. MAN1_4]|nr:DNA adenine methylase [Candidatus Electrothrix sp. MAN1_4]